MFNTVRFTSIAPGIGKWIMGIWLFAIKAESVLFAYEMRADICLS